MTKTIKFTVRKEKEARIFDKGADSYFLDELLWHSVIRRVAYNRETNVPLERFYGVVEEGEYKTFDDTDPEFAAGHLQELDSQLFRLVQILIEKNILTAQDLYFIARGFRNSSAKFADGGE